MQVSYSKHRESKEYINYRIRGILKRFCIANAEKMSKMNDIEKALFISVNCEKLICSEFWIKQKQKLNQQSKAA